MRAFASFRALVVVMATTFLLFSCQQDSNVLTDTVETLKDDLVQRLETTCDHTDELDASQVEGRTTTGSILDFLLSDPDYELLIAAASRVRGLPEILANTRLSVTLFAPTNDAFRAFLTANNIASLEAVPSSTLATILGNHLLPTGKRGSMLQRYESSFTLVDVGGSFQSMKLYIDNTNGVRINGMINVINADNVINRRSVVHKVDRVIVLPTILTFATSNQDFSTLVAALTRPGFSVNFVAALNGATSSRPLTVFAPTNHAFESLLKHLRLTSLDQVPTATLERILLYHVANGNITASQLLAGRTVNTLLGESFTTGLSHRHFLTIHANRSDSRVVIRNIQGVNGVVHAIDQVLLP